MSKLRHSESGKFEKVATKAVKTILYSDSDVGIKNEKTGSKMGAIVKMDFTGDSSAPAAGVINNLGHGNSPGENVGVKRDLQDGNSAPSASVRNLPPHSNVRGRNNKDWGLVK